jgi:CRISPR/Cas system-associated endoribonuclease Cas2
MGGKNFNIIKKTLKTIEIAGGLLLLAMEPGYFRPANRTRRAYAYLEKMMIDENDYKKTAKQDRRKFQNKFYYLRKKGLIDFEYRGNQVYVSLTDEGKKKAGKYKIDDLCIKPAKKWDKIWRVLVFDIEDAHKSKREALRGKIKQLGLYQLQKSVWVCPYEFKKEMALLRDFFGLEGGQMKVITASEIENDRPIRDFFKI